MDKEIIVNHNLLGSVDACIYGGLGAHLVLANLDFVVVGSGFHS
jgi:hypothetical protein